MKSVILLYTPSCFTSYNFYFCSLKFSMQSNRFIMSSASIQVTVCFSHLSPSAMLTSMVPPPLWLVFPCPLPHQLLMKFVPLCTGPSPAVTSHIFIPIMLCL